jgi:putative transposase
VAEGDVVDVNEHLVLALLVPRSPRSAPSVIRSINAMAESVNALYKTELHRNPAALAAAGGHWRGLDDLEIATCGWVQWFNEDRIHGELDDCSPAEVEAAYYRQQDHTRAA